MKKIPPILICIFSIFIGCKKDDTSPGGGTYIPNETIIPMQPPAGFTFPKTYYQSQNTSDFHVWIHDIDKTNLFKPQYFFKNPFVFNVFNIKINNISSMDLIDPSGNFSPINCNYYFFRDTLFVIKLISPDTSPFAIGNFKSFVLSSGNYYLSMSNGYSYGTKSGTDFFTLSKNYVLSHYTTPSDQIDTLSLYNNSITFK